MVRISITLDDNIFKAAQKHALKESKTLNEVINHWAKEGLKFIKNNKPPKTNSRKTKFKTVTLGKINVDLNKREKIIETLEILKDKKIMKSLAKSKKDIAAGRLFSIDEVFGED